MVILTTRPPGLWTNRPPLGISRLHDWSETSPTENSIVAKPDIVAVLSAEMVGKAARSVHWLFSKLVLIHPDWLLTSTNDQDLSVVWPKAVTDVFPETV